MSDEKKIEQFEQKAEEAKRAGEELSQEELEAQAGENLPDREAMSLVDANVAAPVNAAVAANILSEDSTATANAEQTVDIDQSNN
jgi:predicted nucleic acid-binding protein